MPITVEDLLADKPLPVCVTEHASGVEALRLMETHDFSQLPVVHEGRARGLVTPASLLRATRTFGCPAEDLQVRDATTRAERVDRDTDLTDLLARLRVAPAVLVADRDGALVGILTTFDTSEYFRRYAEDLMHVEDIEVTLREFIQGSFRGPGGATDATSLERFIEDNAGEGQFSRFKKALRAYAVLANPGANPPIVEKHAREAYKSNVFGRRALDDLEFQDAILLFTHETRWTEFQPTFGNKRKSIQALLFRVRDLRNRLAHFRGELDDHERATLRFCSEWLGRCRDAEDGAVIVAVTEESMAPAVYASAQPEIPKAEGPPELPVEPLGNNEGAYAALAVYLQGQGADLATVNLTFDELEHILERSLPVSARRHRAWWANDSVAHVQSRAWLDADWRVSSLSITDARVGFTRIEERQKAYIDFFSAVVAEVRKAGDCPEVYGSPHGASWHGLAPLFNKGTAIGWITVSFARGGLLRIDTYIDAGDQARNKEIFHRLFESRERLETEIGQTLTWEELVSKRASRVAVYIPGRISEPESQLVALRKTAAQLALSLYRAFSAALAAA